MEGKVYTRVMVRRWYVSIRMVLWKLKFQMSWNLKKMTRKIKYFLKPCSEQINVDCLAKIYLFNPYIFLIFLFHIMNNVFEHQKAE